ncbi:hypothetical protein FT643_02565 [Ketobacter sp. MCCC 1A13808]|uniref:hypothetical protein n=1 Tax=Ketobacter sp. MCCC 1A13808 TaxID=2602738 RepID=UPI0012EBDD39|nr:hypothetical protein [Ketobacter sp. MCCC 1A13808]MVF11017.1 hypothetical protein [Ketobacter sp. MCCC 1A13808]
MKEFRYSGAAGILIILLSIVIALFYRFDVANPSTEFRIPVLALEFAGSLSQASTLLGTDPAMIRNYDIGHHLDLVFALVYSAFLLFANMGAWSSERNALNLVGIICAAVACSADWAENWQLLQLTDALLGVGAAPDFWLLRLFASTKFLFISISMLCLCPYLWSKGALAKAYCVASCVLPAVTLCTLLGLFRLSGIMILLTSIAWLALFILVIRISSKGYAPRLVQTDNRATGVQR